LAGPVLLVIAMGATLLVLCLSVLGLAACKKEPATGISFSDSRGGASLAGLGARYKGPLKIYAAGVYVAPTLAKLKLGKFRGKAPESLGQDFFDAVVSSGVAKSIVLKMSMGISKEKLASALSDSVKPRMGGDLAAVPLFTEAILAGFQPGGKASSGTKIEFALHGGSTCVAVNGQKCGTVKSAQLADALCKCYFDAKAVSPALKKSCAKGISEML
jgi:hypothetical protein